MLRLYRVTGESLTPDYQEGDFVLIAKIPFFLDSYRPGDVVVLRHPEYGILIKRVESFDAERGELLVIGTHPFSTDSRQFGPVKLDWIIGKVLLHVPAPRA